MRPFPCSVCEQLLFFDNSTCLRCGSPLGFVPDAGELVAVAAGARRRRSCRRRAGPLPPLRESTHRPLQLADPCRRSRRAVCELPPHVGAPERQRDRFARSVRRRRGGEASAALPAHGARAAGRRPSRSTPNEVSSFELLSSRGRKVITGHDSGVITLDLSESDDAHREFVRQQLGEPYRTVLGHLRHEIGHYYWPLLVVEDGRLDAFRDAVRRRTALVRGSARAALLPRRRDRLVGHARERVRHDAPVGGLGRDVRPLPPHRCRTGDRVVDRARRRRSGARRRTRRRG